MIVYSGLLLNCVPMSWIDCFLIELRHSENEWLNLLERRLIEEYMEHNDIVFAWWLKSETNESREGML